MCTLCKKTVIVTGVNTGIGFYTVRFFILKGFRVFGIGRKTNYLLDNTKNFNFMFFNFSNKNFCKVKNLTIALKMSLVINNAGYSNLSYTFKNALGCLKKQLNVTLLPVFVFSTLNYRKVNNDCSLVCINSLSSMYPIPYMGVYNTCKASLTGLVRSLDFENKKKGTKYFNFLLGDVKTRFNKKIQLESKKNILFIKQNSKAWGVLNTSIVKAPHPYSISYSILNVLYAKAGGEFIISSSIQKTLSLVCSPVSWRIIKGFLTKYYAM